jgi:hypothetical protein
MKSVRLNELFSEDNTPAESYEPIEAKLMKKVDETDDDLRKHTIV